MKTVHLTGLRQNELIYAISSSVSSIHCLNRGGCGIFAYLVGKEFEKRGIEFKIAIIHSDSDNGLESVTAEINDYIEFGKIGDDLNMSAFGHCAVEVNSIKFDSDGNNRLYSEGYYDLDEMKVALKFGQWNPQYDTTQTPKLKKEIKQAFIKVLGKYN